jgi:hypothetical protein
VKPDEITRSDLERFVNTLDRRLAAAYKGAHEVTLETEDTLGDDFQLAATIERVFWDYVRALPGRVEAVKNPLEVEAGASGTDPRIPLSDAELVTVRELLVAQSGFVTHRQAVNFVDEIQSLRRQNAQLVEALEHICGNLRGMADRSTGKWSAARMQSDAEELAIFGEAALRSARGEA